MYLQRNQNGYVYIAWNKAMPRLVKIGATNNCAIKRLRNISNQSVPHPFELIATYKTEDCLGFEQLCHRSLQSKHEAKEFFKISKTKAVLIVDFLAEQFEKNAWRVIDND